MSSARNVVLANGEIYHVFNRGVEKRPVFTNKREYQRAIETVDYYRFKKLPIRYSHFLKLETSTRQKLFADISAGPTQTDVLAYCLMPNHFHFLLRQTADLGISRFVSWFCNSYTRYFNTKHVRVGPLLQGTFKAVRVASEEQLLHLSRYIHLNPVASFLVKADELDSYPWSSLPEYLGNARNGFCETKTIGGSFKSIDKYRSFLHDQIGYAQTLERIKHLILDPED